MNPLIAFLASKNGRILRVVLGAVLILLGIFVPMDTTPQILLVVVGLVPFLAGIFDYCVFAPLFGAPFSGKKIRAVK